MHSRIWKAQIPYLARHFRVVTFDGRGNGKSDRPTDPNAYSHRAFAEDAIAVMDAKQTPAAIVVGFSSGGMDAAILAQDYPQRVRGAVFIAPVSPFGEPAAGRDVSWSEKLERTDGWAKHNRHYWRANYADWLEFFASKVVSEPHSTKQVEDIIEWGSQTSADVLIATYEAVEPRSGPAAAQVPIKERYAQIACPVLVIHGTGDAVISYGSGVGVARATGGTLLTIDGAGHCPPAREPVKTNLALFDFAESIERPPRELSPSPRSRAPQAGALHIFTDWSGSRATRRRDCQRTAATSSGFADRLARAGPRDARPRRRRRVDPSVERVSG